MALSAACVTLVELFRGSSDDLCDFTVTGYLQLVDDKVNEPLVVQASEVAVALSFKFLIVRQCIADEITSSSSVSGRADVVGARNKH